MGSEEIDGEESENLLSLETFPFLRGTTEVNLVRPRYNHLLPGKGGGHVCERLGVERKEEKTSPSPF
jgi:hypothetical protein